MLDKFHTVGSEIKAFVDWTSFRGRHEIVEWYKGAKLHAKRKVLSRDQNCNICSFHVKHLYYWPLATLHPFLTSPSRNCTLLLVSLAIFVSQNTELNWWCWCCLGWTPPPTRRFSTNWSSSCTSARFANKLQAVVRQETNTSHHQQGRTEKVVREGGEYRENWAFLVKSLTKIPRGGGARYRPRSVDLWTPTGLSCCGFKLRSISITGLFPNSVTCKIDLPTCPSHLHSVLYLRSLFF